MSGLRALKAKIEYPCTWSYKIIMTDVDNLTKAIEEIAGTAKYSLEPSRSSKHGNYHCFNLTMTLESDDRRLEIYEALKGIPSVVLVL